MKSPLSLLIGFAIAALALVPLPLRAQIKSRQTVINASKADWTVAFTDAGRDELAGREEKDWPSLEIMDQSDKLRIGIVKDPGDAVVLRKETTYTFRYHLPDGYLKKTAREKEYLDLIVMGLCFRDSQGGEVPFFESYHKKLDAAGFSFPLNDDHEEAVPDGFSCTGQKIKITTDTAEGGTANLRSNKKNKRNR